VAHGNSKNLIKRLAASYRRNCDLYSSGTAVCIVSQHPDMPLVYLFSKYSRCHLGSRSCHESKGHLLTPWNAMAHSGQSCQDQLYV
jgi:hypothetical protein